MITAALCAPAKDGVLLREMHGPHIEEMYKFIKRAHDADPASVEALRLFCFKFLSDLMSMYNIFISTSLAELGQANKPPSTFRAFIHLYEDQAREYTHGIASQKFVVVYRSLEAEPHAPVPDVAVRHFFFATAKQLTNDFWASRKELFQVNHGRFLTEPDYDSEIKTLDPGDLSKAAWLSGWLVGNRVTKALAKGSARREIREL
jgi:hypothetical protein